MQMRQIVILAALAGAATPHLSSVRASALQAESPAEGAAPRAEASRGAISIAVKRTDPMRLVYRDFVGPYWRIGPVLQEVQSYAAQSGWTGELFIRFAKSPFLEPNSSQSCQVGFVASADHTPVAPFQVRDRPTQAVAFTTISARAASARGDHRDLHDWARRQGHNTSGEIFELYTRAPAVNGLNAWQTEIQLVLAPSSATAPEIARTAVDTSVAAPPKPSDATPARPGVDAVSPERARPSTDQWAAHEDRKDPTERIIDSDSSDVASSRSAVASPDQPQAESKSKRGRGQVGEEPVSPTGIEAPGIQATTVPEVDTEEPTSDGKQPRPTEPVQKKLSSDRSIRSLLADGHFEVIARMAVPEASDISPEQQLWFGQFVFRLGAATNAIRRASPEIDHPALDAVESMVARYRVQMTLNKLRPLGQPVVRVGRNDLGSGQTLGHLMRDVDRLLGRIALGAIEGEAACEAIVELIEQASVINPAPYSAAALSDPE